MAMTSFQKAAALAAIQVLFAGCSAGNPDTDKTGSTSGTSSPAPAPVPAPAPAPSGSGSGSGSGSTASAPTISAQPQSSSLTVGGQVVFSVTADASTTSYQWYRNEVAIAGATSATYVTPVLTATDDGASFTVKVGNAAGTVESAAATLHVAASTPAPGPSPAPAPGPSPAPAPASGPAITSQPADASAITGSTATFSVAATGSSLSYQWKKNGVAIAGATSATYTTPAVSFLDDGGLYSVVVTGTSGSTASSYATLHLALSSDQRVSEGLSLNGGSYEVEWRLNPVTGQTQVTNVDYVTDDFAVFTASPLTHGPQITQQSHTLSLAFSLADVISGPSRVLKNDTILTVAGDQNLIKTTYVGSSIQSDDLATDGQTVAYSQMRSNYVFTPLTGLLHAAPTTMTQWYNAIFGNANVLDTVTNWQPGAGFNTYTATQLGDRYSVFDCEAATTVASALPSACTTTATTLATFLAAPGFGSSSDGTTYTYSQGTVVTVGTTPVWISNTPRPASGVGSSTVQYRIYFQLNGLFYTGALTRDGTLIGGSHYYDDPANVAGTIHYLNYQVRLNAAAAASLKAGMDL